MLRLVWFILLAALLTIVSYYLTTLVKIPFFSYGVAFIGYFTASILLMSAVFGKRIN
jgi:hypothetical protein